MSSRDFEDHLIGLEAYKPIEGIGLLTWVSNFLYVINSKQESMKFVNMLITKYLTITMVKKQTDPIYWIGDNIFLFDGLISVGILNFLPY
jgi:hypothetical protein